MDHLSMNGIGLEKELGFKILFQALLCSDFSD